MIFWEKSFVLKLLDQNGSKINFFKFYEKQSHGTLLIFCINLWQNKALKVIAMISFGQQKVAQNDFLNFISNRCTLAYNKLGLSDFLRDVTTA